LLVGELSEEGEIGWEEVGEGGKDEGSLGEAGMGEGKAGGGEDDIAI